jgi:hypothetical protein
MFCGGLYDEEIKNTPITKNKNDPWEQMKQREKWNQEIAEKFPDVEINKNGPTILPMHTKSTKIHPLKPKKNFPPKSKIWIMKTWIDESKPQIWRNLAVSEATTLKTLGGLLRDTFSCQGVRNDEFTIRGKRFCMSDHDFDLQFSKVDKMLGSDVLDIQVYNENSEDEGDLERDWLKDNAESAQNPGNPMGIGMVQTGNGGMEHYW